VTIVQKKASVTGNEHNKSVADQLQNELLVTVQFLKTTRMPH